MASDEFRTARNWEVPLVTRAFIVVEVLAMDEQEARTKALEWARSVGSSPERHNDVDLAAWGWEVDDLGNGVMLSSDQSCASSVSPRVTEATAPSACPTSCDDDCEQTCHEVHDIPRNWDHDPKDCPSVRATAPSREDETT